MKSLQESLFNEDLINKNNKIVVTSRQELLKAVTKQLKIQGPDADLNIIDVSKVTDMNRLFSAPGINVGNVDVSNWDVSRVVNMEFMFDGCETFNGDLSRWNVSNVKNTYCMFRGCMSFEGMGLEKWDVKNIKNADSMFGECVNFNADLSRWDVRNLTDAHSMFRGCTKFNQDLSKWDINSRKCNIGMMLDGCTSLKKVPEWWEEYDRARQYYAY